MKRKYNNSKVKPGDWVYFIDNDCETKYSYKVVNVGISTITVEVNVNKKDEFVGGWSSSCIGSGRYWNVVFWTKAKGPLMEIE